MRVAALFANSSETELNEYCWYSVFHSPAGRGIGHQIMCEEGYAFPGTMAVSLNYLCYAISSVELREFSRGCLFIAVQSSSLREDSDQEETRLLLTRIQICTGKALFEIVASCSGLLFESRKMLRRRFAYFGHFNLPDHSPEMFHFSAFNPQMRREC